ncbi:MAG TPA: homoserine kinase [Caulobacteraceae bacterium]
MAVYTDITDEELEGLLGQYDLGRPLAFKGIAEGVSNSNFLLDTDNGRFILTIYERRFVESELPWFMQLLEHLAGHGFPSATPVHARDGAVLKKVRGKPCALISFLPGLSVRRPTAAHCREAGMGLAWLHQAGEGFTARRANALGHEHWARMFHPLRRAADELKPGLAETIEGDLATFAAGWPRELPEGVIHADWFPDNVFFQEGRFAGAIDFYFACHDQLAYDIAVALNAWCFEADGSFNLTAARGLIAGYESRRPLTDAERAALPMLAHGAAMRFFLTRLADWGSTPDGAMVRPKDPLEYERKLAVHRAGLALIGEAA